MTQKVGVIGLGNMGQTIARHLASQEEFHVYGFDIDEESLQTAKKHDIQTTKSIGDLVSEVELVITSLPNPDAVRAVYLGEDGILSSRKEGLITIEASTIDPDTTTEIAGSLTDAGIHILDAPVSGGVERAADGQLTLMVGGDRDIFDRNNVQNLLNSIGSDIYYAGETGSGHTLKLLNNLIALGNEAIAMEVSALAAELGVDWDVYLDVVGNSSGSSHIFRKNVPKVLNRNFDATFTLELSQKDSRLALDMADNRNFPAMVSDLAYQIRQNAVAKGFGNESINATAKVYEDLTSKQVEAEQIDEEYFSWKDK